MGDMEAYAWSATGGLVMGLVVYLLPPLIYAYETREHSRITRKDLAWIGGILAVLTFISGFGYLLANGDVTSHAEAFKLGIGAQAAIKGFAAGGREAFGGRKA